MANLEANSFECDDDFMERVRSVIFGEASNLLTFYLKNNQRLTKSNYVQLSKLSSLILEDEDEAEINEENLIIDPLIKNLILLRSRLSKEKILSIEESYIKPFCDVIVNKDVSGPITGLALQSILKFLNYDFIKDGEIVRLIGESVTKARFVGTDSNSDEAVLMRILSVLETLVLHPFYSLSNGVICEIMQSCFRIAFETRLSELLRKCAVKSLTEMVRALFLRIAKFDSDSTDFNYFYKDKSNASYYKLNRMGRRFVNQTKHHENKAITINKDDWCDSDSTLKSYGLACIYELLSYLTSLINPLPDGQNSDYMISVGLNLLIVIFENAVHEIGAKYCLLSVVKTDLCWNIMQLLQNEKNLNLFDCVLRLAFLIFVNLRRHLKYQFETLILRMMDIISTANMSLEYRDLCADYLLLLFRHIPFLPHELFLNFDCDPYSANILEDLLELFSKNCFSTSNQNTISSLNYTILQMLSFEALLSNLKSLQKVELCKESYLTANPATMIVNISNINEALCNKSLTEEPYNICSNTASCSIDDHNAIDVTGDAGIVKPTSATDLESSLNENADLSPVLENIPSHTVMQPEAENLNTGATINKYCVTYLFPHSSMLLSTTEQIAELKQRKASLWTATERFNQKPTKGIEYLYETKLVQNEDDIVAFLRNNSKLDKKLMGEYLSNKKNMTVLTKFVESFVFKDIRIDEALRLYLESFRLPGEAPLISLVLEQFAHHWHESNNCPFENEDAAFSLAYAIIMLNVDQHNSNVKRQTNPMTCDEFISNLRQVNGGKDFDRNMLTEIYNVIKNNEIIMPAEQQGIVKEKYLWKCLLKNSETHNGIYWFYDAKNTNELSIESFKENKDSIINLYIFNKAIFGISWGPLISALTFVLDKINPDKQPTLARRVLNSGFTSYSLLCANYGHLDNLIENLSKFVITSSSITSKSEMVAHCLLGITKEFSNEMRTSWKKIVELILFWYDNKLLDDGLEIEDFALESKKIRFSRKKSTKYLKKINDNANQSTFLSSFYLYFASNSQLDESDPTQECNQDEKTGSALSETKADMSPPLMSNEYCQALILIIDESKFLHIDSLIELIKGLIQVQLSEEFDDDLEIFTLEILVKIILMNRDRLMIFWDHVYKYIIRLMKYCPQSENLTERIISSIFRLAIRFTSRPDSLNEQIFLLIYQMLLFFDPTMLQRKVTAQALHSFVSHCICFYSKNEEWALIFNMILSVSVGYYPSNKKMNYEQPDTFQRGYTSDSEVVLASNKVQASFSVSPSDLAKLSSSLNLRKNFSDNIFTINYPYRILDVEAYEKCVDIMSFIIREYLPNNSKTLPTQNNSHNTGYEVAQMAVGALCKFVEASIKIQLNPVQTPRESYPNKNYKVGNKSRLSRLTNAILSSSESDSEDEIEQRVPIQSELSSVTENVSMKLLDLMHYFHLNAPSMVGDNVSPDALWNSIWCPLLQAISFFCCDCRRPVRTSAFTFMQRTLLLHDLNALNCYQWESCFNKVLFPLLSKLLEPINMCDPIGMDEIRMRTTNLLCKVFLQHLNPLLTLNTFTALWLTILDFMDKYIKADMQTELVKEAIPESLKNILLVMKTAGCFNDTLAAITWDRINVFLPNLYHELFVPQEQEAESNTATEVSSELTISQANLQVSPSQIESLPSRVNEDSAIETVLYPVKQAIESSPLETTLSSSDQVSADQLPESSHDQIPSESQSLLAKPTQENYEELYNLPSTFIDMESVCVLQDSSTVALKNPIYHYPTMAYPGTIAQFYPEASSPTTNYIQHSNSDKQATMSTPKSDASNTSSPYPWPMPNMSQSNY